MSLGDTGFGDRSKAMLQKLEEKGVLQKEGQEQPQQEEVIQEQPEAVEENIQEEPQPEVIEDSSLNNENKEEQPSQEHTQEIESDGFGEVVDLNEKKEATPTESGSTLSFTDKDALSFMNEKFGQSFESIEDAVDAFGKQSDPLSDISSQAKALDKFLKETGRNPLEWINAQVVDYEKLSEEQAIILDYTSKGYSDTEARDLYDAKFRAEVIPEHLDEDEVAAIKKSNRLREIERNAKSRESKQSLMDMKEKYNAPMESWKPIVQETKNEFTSEVKEAFSKKATETLESLKTVDIPISEGKVYRVSTEKYLSENKDTFLDPEKFIASKFKDENGNWDAEKMIRAAMYEENFNDMVSYSTKNAFQMGQKEQASHGRNLTFDSSNPKKGNHASETEAQKKFKSELAQIKAKQGRNKGMTIQGNFNKKK